MGGPSRWLHDEKDSSCDVIKEKKKSSESDVMRLRPTSPVSEHVFPTIHAGFIPSLTLHL